jgi:hypothetical protein
MALFSQEMTIPFKEALKWWDYDQIHIYFMAPVSACGCDACDRGRLWEKLEEELYETR